LHADLADSSEHSAFDLLKSVGRRVVDRRVTESDQDVDWNGPSKKETDQPRRKTARQQARDNRRGFARTHPSHPLLANIYMRRLVVWGGSRSGLSEASASPRPLLSTTCDPVPEGQRRRGACINCADHGKMKLRVNEDKTQICTVPEGSDSWVSVRANVTLERRGKTAWHGDVTQEHQAHGRKRFMRWTTASETGKRPQSL